jgi:hypothetical protein
VVEGSGAGGKQAPHAQTEQPDAGPVDPGAGHDPVQDGGDDVLPVGSEHEALEVASRGLAGPVEGEHVVTALDSCGGAVVVHLLGAAVEAVVQDHRRARSVVALAPGGAVEVPVQDGVLVRDLHHLDRWGEQRRGGVEALRGAVIGVVDARVGGVSVQEELRGPVVVIGPHQPVAGTGTVTGSQLGRLGAHCRERSRAGEHRRGRRPLGGAPDEHLPAPGHPGSLGPGRGGRPPGGRPADAGHRHPARGPARLRRPGGRGPEPARRARVPACAPDCQDRPRERGPSFLLEVPRCADPEHARPGPAAGRARAARHRRRGRCAGPDLHAHPVRDWGLDGAYLAALVDRTITAPVRLPETSPAPAATTPASPQHSAS